MRAGPQELAWEFARRGLGLLHLKADEMILLGAVEGRSAVGRSDKKAFLLESGGNALVKMRKNGGFYDCALTKSPCF
jgi:hypothetical protein